MIKLLRKIRQRLRTENLPAGQAGKFSKYLLCAIGEIVWVVIGILIALGINNWKENKSSADTEFGYMQNLKEDLQVDIQLYNGYLDTNAELY